MKVNEFLDNVCDTLNRQRGTLGLEDTPNTVQEWDSLGHLSIVAMVNLKLRVPADDPEVVAFGSLGELVDMLVRKDVLERN